MKVGIRETKTVVRTVEYNFVDLCEALGLPQQGCEIYVRVPSGGDYSDCILTIGVDTDLVVKTTSETAQEEGGRDE